MPSILITGAGRGLGLEFAKQYTGLGYRVFATARDPAKATELAKLAKAHTSLSVHALDVDDEAGVRSLVSALKGEPIDILLNNAGTMGPKHQSLGSIDYAGLVETFVSNTVAPLRIAEALVDNVAKSQRKLIVAVTSGMGSISDSSGGYYAYRASKAALNGASRLSSSTPAGSRPTWADREPPSSLPTASPPCVRSSTRSRSRTAASS